MDFIRSAIEAVDSFHAFDRTIGGTVVDAMDKPLMHVAAGDKSDCILGTRQPVVFVADTNPDNKTMLTLQFPAFDMAQMPGATGEDETLALPADSRFGQLSADAQQVLLNNEGFIILNATEHILGNYAIRTFLW